MYAMNDAWRRGAQPLNMASDWAHYAFDNPHMRDFLPHLAPVMAASAGITERVTRDYGKPQFGINKTVVDGKEVAVFEEVVATSPFMDLKRFRRDIPEERNAADPRALVVAPMSGHFATLLRGTVEGVLPDHDVYITEWKDPSLVAYKTASLMPPFIETQLFDLDDYTAILSDVYRLFGGDVHVMAVCQPGVPVLASVALSEEEGADYSPLSMTLMGSPINADPFSSDVKATMVNRLAVERGTGWYRENVIATVPLPRMGAGRPVYPGFLQLTGFMAMNLERHNEAHRKLFDALIRGDGDSKGKHDQFYDEYLAVMDLTAEFFLQTVDSVFVNHHLPKGEMVFTDNRGRQRLVNPAAIRKVALMTVEGEKDDITGEGQTKYAHVLARNIPEAARRHIVVEGAGHYGIFNGKRAERDVFPEFAAFTRAHNHRRDFTPSRGLVLRACAA